MKNEFHVAIEYLENVPSEYISSFQDDIACDGLEFKSRSREPELYMAMEWVVPSVIVAYLSKPYFEAFLKEAGKDHYHLLKKAFLILLKKIFGKSPEKRDSRHSQLFSIMAKLDDNKTVKFIFPESVSIEDYEVALDKLYDLISSHYSKSPNDDLSRSVKKLTAPSNIVYLEYISESNEWKILDPFLEAKRLRKEQDKVQS